MKKNKIIIILSNASGGIASYETNLINFCNGKNIPSIIFNNTKINHKLEKVRSHKTKFVKTNLIWHPISSINEMLKLNDIQDKKYFVISNTLIFSIYFPIIKFFIKNKKIVLIMHSHITNKKISQYIICFISSFFSIFSDRIIFVSKFTRSWWIKRFLFFRFSNNIVKYNLVSLKNNQIKKANKKFTVGFVGRLDKEKNVKKFLEIAEKAKKEKCIKFFVYGDGNEKNLVKSNKVVSFKKWSNKKEFLKKIDLLLVTSPIENCPYSVLETKSFGIPTLNLAKGGIREIVKEKKDGINLKNDNFKSIIKNIKYIKANYSYFSQNCLINSKRFDLRKMKYFFKL